LTCSSPVGINCETPRVARRRDPDDLSHHAVPPARPATQTVLDLPLALIDYEPRWTGSTRPSPPTTGAAFDFHAHLVPQAPPWLQQLGLEWAFRLAHEPRRLGRRWLASRGSTSDTCGPATESDTRTLP
jgi:hypothetical protein